MGDKKIIRLKDNVTPNRVIEKSDGQGGRDVYYSNKGDAQHGHSHQNADGTVDFSRTRRGRKV
ncbi:MAG: hypothetical protein ACFFCS_15390 [Candidatus Hodarchaeota archaeon]